MEAITKIQDLKNQFAQKTGYEDWYDYLSYCKSNGFDECSIDFFRKLVLVIVNRKI